MNAIAFNNVEYTKKSLFNLGGKDLVALHNAAAKKVGKAETKRFSSIAAGVDRTWSLLTEAGTEVAAKALPAQPAASMGTVTAAKASSKKPAKAKKVAAAKDPKEDITLEAATKPASVRPGLNDAIYAVAKAAGPTKREALITKVLAEVTPPRSQHYEREFVLGYLAHGVRQGYLKVKE